MPVPVPAPLAVTEAPPGPGVPLAAYRWAICLAAYAVLAGVMLCLVLAARAGLARTARRATPVEDGRVLRAFGAARARLALRRVVRVAESVRIETPLTIGTLRPVVLLPTGFADSLCDDDLAAVALHESAHVKRYDSLALDLASIFRALFFFHPLVWYACRRIALLTEEAADDVVLDATHAPVAYAKTLALLAERLRHRPLSTHLAAGIVLSKSTFVRRVKAILSQRRPPVRALSIVGMIVAAIVVGASLVLAAALPISNVINSTDSTAPAVSQDNAVTARAGDAPARTPAAERGSVELSKPTLAGVVLDDAGKPLSGATVNAIPGVFGRPAATGEDGRFSLASQVPLSPEETVFAFVVHAGRNLAAVVPVEGISKPLEVKMLPARGLKGRVLDPSGKPVTGAKVAVIVWFGNVGCYVSDPGLSADASGVYQMKTLPDGQSYSVEITAKGYGRKTIRTSLAGATDKVVTLEDARLPVADKSVSGAVVDADGKGIKGALVRMYGENQADSQTQSGRNGKFKFDSVVDAPVSIHASVLKPSLNGFVRVTAGDENVTVVVRPQGSGEPAAPPKKLPKPLAGKPLPDLKSLDASASWTAAVKKAASKPILVVFFDSTQRPSRSVVSALSERAKDLAAKGVAVFCCDVSGAGPDATSQWVAKTSVPFPVAAVAKPDEVQRAWRVQALPWLILADKTGVVRSEGFQPTQLDARLAEAAVK